MFREKKKTTTKTTDLVKSISGTSNNYYRQSASFPVTIKPSFLVVSC